MCTFPSTSFCQPIRNQQPHSLKFGNCGCKLRLIALLDYVGAMFRKYASDHNDSRDSYGDHS